MFGLQLTAPSFHFRKLQTTKSYLLKHSLDHNVRALYDQRQKREAKMTRISRGSHFLSDIEPVVVHNLKVKGQMGRRGLGDGRYIKPQTFKECRKLISMTMANMESERRVVHSRSLALQGVWTHWMDIV